MAISFVQMRVREDWLNSALKMKSVRKEGHRVALPALKGFTTLYSKRIWFCAYIHHHINQTTLDWFLPRWKIMNEINLSSDINHHILSIQVYWVNKTWMNHTVSLQRYLILSLYLEKVSTELIISLSYSTSCYISEKGLASVDRHEEKASWESGKFRNRSFAFITFLLLYSSRLSKHVNMIIAAHVGLICLYAGCLSAK